jgi:regulatory protein
MDREELVESSSSQNVKLSITSLQKRGSGKETVTVSLSDGSSFFIPIDLNASWIPAYILSEEDLALIKEEDSYIRGKEWAASRLALREDSSGRMAQKLMQREYSPALARRIVAELSEMGFLDDERFASLWLRERMRSHPEGRDALFAGLMKRGVPSAIAGDCIADNVSDEDIEKGLDHLIEKLKSRNSLSNEKLILRLQRRGYSYSSIKKKLDRDN